MKQTKLYNMILPPFMLFAFTPLLWICSMAGNFVIDSLVIIILFGFFLKKDRFNLYKKNIIHVWILGYCADLVGVVYLLLISTIADFIRTILDFIVEINPDQLFYQILDGMYVAVNHSHFDSFWGVLFIISGIIVASVFIFLFNYHYVFKKRLADVLTKKQMIIASLSIAIATAPYTFLLPKELFY